MPDLPTMIEAGVKDFEVVSWNGMSAPAGTPKDIVDKIAKAIQTATRDQTVAARLNAIGVTPNGNSPAEFSADFKAAIAAEPYNTTALYNLGLAYTRSGQRDEGQSGQCEERSCAHDLNPIRRNS